MKRTPLVAASLILASGLLAGPVQAQEICRTPGFWGTHAGDDKNGSTNITEEVIRAWLSASNSYDQTATDKCTFNGLDGTVSCDFEPPGPAGSPKDCREAKKNDVTLFNNFPSAFEGIEICGQTISVNHQDSEDVPPVVEALCVSPSGDSTLQLGRQLTAASLNCMLSGGGADCANTSVADTFSSCNEACTVSGQEDHVNTCIEQLDCFNNGGVWNEDDPQAMFCQMDVEESCHAQPLIGTVMTDSDDPGGPGTPQ